MPTTNTTPAPAQSAELTTAEVASWTAEFRIFGLDYDVAREGESFRVTSDSGESHVFTWDGVRLVGPSYGRVPSEFRAFLAARLREEGQLEAVHS